MKLGLEGPDPSSEESQPRRLETRIGQGPQGPPSDLDAERVEASGRLHFLGELARGGMGVVHWVWDASLGRGLAVKALRQKHRDQPNMVERFVAEARITGQLQHPGIPPVHEMGFLEDGRPFFSMKLVKGRTLAEVLAGRDDPVQGRAHLVSVFLQVAQTLAYAHEHGVIHLDVKPSNIMLGKHGEVQVMDWGLARLLAGGAGARVSRDGGAPTSPSPRPFSDPSGETASGDVHGTPDYIAPERFGTSPDQFDARTDVFALGVVLCEVLTGRLVYEGDSIADIRASAARGEWTGAHEALDHSGADPALIALTKECLAADREARPPDAGAVARRLAKHLEGVQERLRQVQLAEAEARARVIEERKRRRLTALFGAVFLALLATGTILGVFAWRAAQAREVQATLNVRDVESIAREAREDPTGDPSRWRAVLDSTRRTSGLIAVASNETRSRLASLEVEASTRLDQALGDQRLLRDLESARLLAEQWDITGSVERSETAFRDAGLDLNRLGPQALGNAVAARPAQVRKEIVAGLDHWAFLAQSPLVRPAPGAAPWRSVLEAARVADPDPTRDELRTILATGRFPELARVAQRRDLVEYPAATLHLLGRMLSASGLIAESQRVLLLAWRLQPEDFWVNLDLAWSLRVEPSKPELALAFASAAVALRPENAFARYRRGDVLELVGSNDEAISEFRAAVRLQPDFGLSHFRLGMQLWSRGELDAAIEAMIMDIEQKLTPDRIAPARSLLCSILFEAHRDQQAAELFEKAIAASPDDGDSWVELAKARVRLRDRAGAAAAVERAAKIVAPDSPRNNDLTALRADLERLDQLPRVLGGELRPDEAARLDWADFSARVDLGDPALRFYEEAFAADPKLLEEALNWRRDQAAFLAVRFGCGLTKDSAPGDDAQRARRRRLGLTWLRTGWTALQHWLKPEAPREVKAAAKQSVAKLLNHPDLAGVREAKALATLPDDEAELWRSFWKDLAAVPVW